MGKTIGNAKNQTDFYRVTYDGSALAIVSGLTGTTAAAALTDRAFSLDLIEEAPPQYQDTGAINVTFNQFADDKALNDFLNAVAKPKATGSSRPERFTQSGVKHGGSGSSDYVLMVYYGGADDTDGIKVTVAIGKLSPASGSHSDKYNEWTNPVVEFVGAVAPAELVIPAALFDSTIVDATNVATKIPKILEGEGFVREFVTVAA
jgi:hypothetical protein